MIKQFLTDVEWGERDYLIIDTPPGTSDEHITVVEQLKKIRVDGAVVVTTPQVRTLETRVFAWFYLSLLFQAVALSDVRRELTFCRKTGTPVLGIVENMSGFVCPHCSVSFFHVLFLLFLISFNAGMYQYIFNRRGRIASRTV